MHGELLVGVLHGFSGQLFRVSARSRADRLAIWHVAKTRHKKRALAPQAASPLIAELRTCYGMKV